ncbi:hypothetical protein LCGC14_3150970, partial [marine sediment metagenome]
IEEVEAITADAVKPAEPTEGE